MKKVEIALIIVAAVVIGIIFSYSYNVVLYGNFTDAFAQDGKTYKVVGTINKKIPIYTEANLVVFNMIDENGKEYKVELNKTVPEHFDRSDKVVVTGQANTEESIFKATDYQAKCPSKYADEE
ncbi:cytochrome c maturation protein CcmE [Flavobacteriales bacterium]|nr:cytochrome c maturation protein CcmE [Flavobacteriales bacterium]